MPAAFGVSKITVRHFVLAAVVTLLLLPVGSLVWIASTGNFESLSHILENVLPRTATTTLLLMVIVGVIVATIGTVSAWLVCFCEFPMRRVFEWALMLPFAVPTYISAYAFVEFFAFTGPVQTLVRQVGGFSSPREYWFPEVRSLWGAGLVMGLVLYPYVYLAVRTVFLYQSGNIPDAARALGASGGRLLRKVTLPLARPAIALGVTLALMETINDIGAVEHLGVETLTFSIFSIWLNQNDLPGAAQLSLFLLFVVVVLVCSEYWSRGGRNYHGRRVSVDQEPARISLKGARAVVAIALCLAPIVFGFGVPVTILAGYAVKSFDPANIADLYGAFLTTTLLGLCAAGVTIPIGLFLAHTLRNADTTANRILVRLASSGYAIPGTLVALGLFLPLANLDNWLDETMRNLVGVAVGLLITGSGAAIIFAYVIRFMAMAEGTLGNGFRKLSPNLEMAGRSLGHSRSVVMRVVLLPLLRPAIVSAALLVFVEVVKELSATIMLRPFGVNTLATRVYDFASQARVEDAAPACLMIILAGMIPVVFLLGRSSSK